MQVAEIRRDGHVAHHRTADEYDLATILVRGVDHLLHAVHMAGEAGDDDLARSLGKRLVKSRTDGGLRLDEAGNLGVRGIHHQQIHALFADLAEFDQIGDAMIQRQLVKLDIAGIDQGAGRRLDVYGQRIRNGMRDVDEFKVERAGLELVTPGDLDLRRVDVVLLALCLRKGKGELGADQRDIRAKPKQVRHAADMILMTMRKHQRLDLVETILDIAEIGKNQIDAGLLLLREEHTAVDEQQVAVVFDHVHVAPDLAQTAKWRDAHRALAILRRGDQHRVLLGRGGLRCALRVATTGSRRSTTARSALLGLRVVALARRRTAATRAFRCFLFLCHTEGLFLIY